MTWGLLLLAPLTASHAAAQTISTATATAVSTEVAKVSLGAPLPFDRGPWVLGEVLFFSNGKILSQPGLRERIRGSRGALYSRTEILADSEALLGSGRFERIEPALYEIPQDPVPPDFVGVAVSTHHVRLVYNVTEKPTVLAAPAGPPPRAEKKKKQLPPSPISGVVFTPTAYRGAGKSPQAGLGLDINGMYMIGRLYGTNGFENTPRKTNYIDRIGVWMLSADGKIQMQSESALRPAVAVGGIGTFLFRDSGQPKVGQLDPSVQVNASQKSTRLLSAGYAVVSKKFWKVRTSAGFMRGNQGDMVREFSEFFSPDALNFFAGKPGTLMKSNSIPFASVLMLPKPEYPLAVEFMQFNGAPLHPWMLNFKVGYFLRLNFDVAYLRFDGGSEWLGLIQFRYNHFPPR